jgi:hypothetical protein
MKVKLLAIFISVAGFANAQYDASFSWSFNSATDTLSLTANADNFGFIDKWFVNDTITNAGAESYYNLNTFKVAIPYGIYNFYITHLIANGTGYICSVIDTIDIDNTNGSICDPGFLVKVDYVVPYTILYGVNHPDLSHIWIFGDDTISTTYYCGIDQQVNFSIQHIVYNNSGCYQELIDTVGEVTTLSETVPDVEIGSPFPNPTKDNITVSINAKKLQSLTFTAYNLLGQPVLSQNISVSSGNQTIKLPTENLAQGIYILHIADKRTGAVVTKKIVKD